MLFYEFKAGGNTYKLRLNTRNIVSLEKALGGNPLSIFGKGDRIPTITEMVTVLHQSAQQFEHQVDMDAAYDIFDKYVEEGHAMTDFITVIVEIYKVSGIIKEDAKLKKA